MLNNLLKVRTAILISNVQGVEILLWGIWNIFKALDITKIENKSAKNCANIKYFYIDAVIGKWWAYSYYISFATFSTFYKD